MENMKSSNTTETQIISHDEAHMLEWDTLISFIANLCYTQPGKNYCMGMQPLDYNEILEQYAKINCLKEILSIGHHPDFSGIHDITYLLEKSSKGATLQLDEIFKIRLFITAQYRITSFFKSIQYPHNALTELQMLHPCEQLYTMLISSLTDSGNLNENTYPVLKKLQREINDIRNAIEKSLQNLIHSHEYQQIVQEKIFTVKNNRYCIPIKTTFKNKLKGTIADISSSGATLYIEPDSIHDLNNTLLYKELDLQREIEKILQILSSTIAEHAHLLMENAAIIGYLDFCTALARFAVTYNASTPALSRQPYLRLFNAKHPLLVTMHGKKIVPCDIECGINFKCLIISGVNTGGKTVLLKMLGLFALMVRYGLPITASPDSTAGYFESVYADIGDEQNIMQSLSTFSGQIKNIVRILNLANEKSLVLIDEIIVGTDPKQGAAIAQAVLQYLVNKKAVVAVTTHYSQLKEIASVDSQFENASVVFDIHTMQPTYQVLMGIPGASYTIEIAKNLSLPQKIIDDAISLLDSTSLTVDALLSQITQQSHTLHQKEQELALLKQELNQLKNDYDKKINELQQQIEKVTKEQAIEFVHELHQYRNTIIDKIRTMQSMSMKDATQLVNDITQMQLSLQDTIKQLQKPSEDFLPCTVDTVQKGSKVFIKPLEQYGYVEDVDEKSKQLKVRMGTVNSRFSFDDVYCIPESKKLTTVKTKTNTIATQDIQHIPISIQTKYNTIDLRGLYVDEALQKMDHELDNLLKNNIPTAIIIHGHGTGSLKKAIRQYLKHSFYVKGYRPGQPEEGGDGVTVVQLR